MCTLKLIFEWDDDKTRRNLREHGISFSEAEKAFDDPDGIRGDDEEHSKHEPRQWLLGMTPRGRILLVIFTERAGSIMRIITAWKANRMEREFYESERRKD